MSISLKSLLNLTYPFSLPELAYPYEALEPYIDAKTMQIHHTKHHQTYIDTVNKALEAHPELQTKTLGELLTLLPSLPTSIKTSIQNHGGGHKNHSFFWALLSGNKQEPSEFILTQMVSSFGSFKNFQETFNNAAKSRFGSGWAWLNITQEHKLIVSSTANQDSPLTEGMTPILGLDVWEHAYYLKYQNKRVDYLDSWWHVINWQQVEAWYKEVTNTTK